MRSKRVLVSTYLVRGYTRTLKTTVFTIIFFTQLTDSCCPSFVQLVPLQLLPHGNGSVDRENAYHADELRLLLR